MDDLGTAHRAVYDEMILDGETPNMAEMLLTQTFAGVSGTNAGFNRVESERMRGMDDQQREDIVKIARKAGINTTGKSYNGQLGKYGDAGAWISDTSDVRNVCEKKGLSVRGMVNVENTSPMERAKANHIAPDILNRLERAERKKNPLLDKKCATSPTSRKELRAKITSKHAYKKKS